MFGYVRPVRADLLVRDYDFYRATYCGVCRSMRAHTGLTSCASLSYDSVYLALVRMVFLPDEDIAAGKKRCIAHPLKSRPMLHENLATVYTARAFALLTAYKLDDDLADESAGKRALLLPTLPILHAAAKRAGLPALAARMEKDLLALREKEKENCPSVDDLADLFGDLLGETFAYGLDGSAATLAREIGFHLGRFIYCADAAEDVEKDVKEHRFNPYVAAYGKTVLDEKEKKDILQVLLFEINRVAMAVDLLPFGNRRTLKRLLRNITEEGLPERVAFLERKSTKQEKTE